MVATPIGNLGDMTPRGIEALRTASLVLCEDTRHSRPLLSHFGVTTPVEALHEHNEARMVGRVLDLLETGAVVSLISDAGTPLVSDPGSRLVAAAVAAGHRVTPFPGATAVMAALVGAGLGDGPFTFLGFLERTGKGRREQLANLSTLPHLGVVYESPQRLGATLADLEALGCGERRVVVARELTKRFEEFRRGTVAELAAAYRTESVKGEVVLVLEGAPAAEPVDRSVAREAAARWRGEGLGTREVARRLVEEMGLSRNEAYRLSLEEN